MGHRKWTYLGWREIGGAQLVAEHDALYDAYKNSEKWRMDCLDENNRLDRELDEARKRIAELEAPPVINKVTGLPTGEYAPLRVPFSDAQIERMAIAASDAYSQYWIAQDFPKLDYPRNLLFRKWEEHGEKMKESRILMIRAALAAGGIEPCAPPQYDPADVALRMPKCDGSPVVQDISLGINCEHEVWKTPIQIMSPLSGSGASISIDACYDEDYEESSSLCLVVGATEDGDEYTSCAMSPADAARMAAWLSSYAAAHGAPDSDLRAMLTDAERKIHNQRMSLRELHEARGRDAAKLAAVTAERDKWEAVSVAQDQGIGRLKSELAALRDPVGKPELDVTAEEALCKWLDFVQDNTMINTIREYNDWLRSRIRPTYECKECAEWLKKYQERDYKYIKAQAETQAEGTKVYALENKIAAARAALEGE